VAVIPAPEYDRLRALARVVSWFRGAGLDLASASEQEIIDFVRRKFQGTDGSTEQALVEPSAWSSFRGRRDVRTNV